MAHMVYGSAAASCSCLSYGILPYLSRMLRPDIESHYFQLLLSPAHVTFMYIKFHRFMFHESLNHYMTFLHDQLIIIMLITPFSADLSYLPVVS